MLGYIAIIVGLLLMYPLFKWITRPRQKQDNSDTQMSYDPYSYEEPLPLYSIK